MWTHGRARALTVITPMRRGLITLQRLIYWVEQPFVRTRHHKTDVMGLVYALRWNVVRRNEQLGIAKPRLLFLSNFVGDWDDYIDVFLAVHRVGLLIHFLSAKGFPNLGEARLVRDYIRDRDRQPLTYYCGYSTASPRDVRWLHDSVDVRPDPDPTWVISLLPLVGDPHTIADVTKDARQVFAVPGIHFARLTEVRFDGPPVLLLAVTYDRSNANDPAGGTFATDEDLFGALLDNTSPGSALWSTLLNSDDRTIQMRRLLDGRIRSTDGLSYFIGGGLNHDKITSLLPTLRNRT